MRPSGVYWRTLTIMIGDPFWQRIDTNTLVTHALQTRPTMAFGADNTTLGALSPKKLSGVMMGTPKDGKVAIAKFGLIAEDKQRQSS